MSARHFVTIGYGGRRPAEFVALLKERDVATVVDVRLRPDRASFGAYSLSASPDKGIVALLAGGGIGYRSLVELGNVFMGLDDWRERYVRLLDQAEDVLLERLLAVPPVFALLCAEKSVDQCHRGLIAGRLVARGWSADHIE